MFEEIPKRNKGEVFMAIAHQLAILGTCDRALVGAVIVKDGRCISWGYNGAPPGAPHCEDNMHGWYSSIIPEAMIWDKIKENGCKNATHAEANAIAFAARQGISTEGCTLYLTVAPCDSCARLIVAAGIEKVIWAADYRNKDGEDVLRKSGITLGVVREP